MLNIYNSLTQTKEEFKPINKGKIGIYVCGITTYDYLHLGHARMMVAFDVVTRYLRARGYEVNYVRNITDIDDKILNRARENGELFSDLTDRFIDAMHEDEAALAVLPPDVEPRATGHITEIVDMIKLLVEKDMAYRADNGDVYFSVMNFPGYGKLSKKKMDELLDGARIEVGELKKDPRDFVLWKSSPDDGVGWDSPWGYGRPGWHIECSVMSLTNLGEHFDIHGGGPDLLFPHHENEIAQSECSSGKQFANYWLHSGLLKINGEKMSKSLGNFAMLKDLFVSYHPEVLRYYLVSSHYRSSLNFDNASLDQARSALARLYQALASVEGMGHELDQDMMKQFSGVMNDDLNTPEALSILFQLAKLINNSSDSAQTAKYAATLKELSGVLGLLQDDPKVFFQFGSLLLDEEIEKQIVLRNQARDTKDFQTADQIRESLLEQGIILDDSSEGTTWKKS